MKCYKNIIVIICFFVFAAIGGKAWAAEQTVTWTASSGALGSGIGSGTISTGTYAWSYTRTLKSGSSYTGWDTNSSGCIQLGKNGGVENITFTTSAIPGTIKSVSVECSSYQAGHNVSITVGGTTYLASTATASWTTVSAKTGTGTSSGEIVISFTGGTRALYIKSITVVYETSGGVTPCTPEFSSDSDYITNFTLGSINNTTGFSTNGYGNYTNLSTDLGRDATISASLTSSSGSGSHGAAVWIDFNDDGTFDSSERVGAHPSSIGANTTVNITLTIPPDAVLGPHRLRVVYQFNTEGTSINACVSASYGEVEDYTVNIIVPVYYNVYYDANDGSGTMIDSNSPYASGSFVTVLANTFTRSGYVFVGWSTSASGPVNHIYDSGNAFTISSDVTLYAQWVELGVGDCHSVTFSDLGYGNETPVSSVEISASPSINMTLNQGSGEYPPKYFTSGSSIRVYGGNIFTISTVGSDPIISIVFTFSDGGGDNAISANTGTYNSGIWIGSASSVTFTVSAQRRLASVEVCVNPCRNPIFTLSSPSETIATNSDLNLVVASNNSNGTISWSSSNTSVATVDGNGRVRGLEEGHCVITAIVAGDGTYCESTATCNIHVADDDCIRVGWGVVTSIGEGGVYYLKNTNKYSYTQQIYSASEIRMAGGSAGTISSIKVHHAASGITSKSDIYMGLTTEDGLSQDWVGGLTIVAANKTINYINGWTEINLDTPFEWDGASNIVVAFNNSVTSGSSERCYKKDVNSKKYRYYNSNSSIALSSANVPSTYTGISDYRTNMKFCITPCEHPVDAYFSSDVVNVNVGGNLNLSSMLTVNPLEGNVTYTSGNTSVATVNPTNGEVNAVAEGATIITAHVAQTNGGNCSANARITVMVCNCPDNTDQTYIIGTASNVGYGPITNNYRYSYKQMIYPRTDLHKGTIKSISYYYEPTTAMTRKTSVDVYMVHTTKSEFINSSDWVSVSSANRVYSGSFNCSHGWNRFDLQTPFEYNGCDNLLVAIDDNSGSYDGENKFYYTTTFGVNTQIYNNSDSDVDPDGSPYGTTTTNYSDIKFCIEESDGMTTNNLIYDVSGNCSSTATPVSIDAVNNVSYTTVTSIVPHCSDYAGFGGWNTEVDASGIYYYAGDRINVSCWDNDVTLHAIYNNAVNGESSCESAVAFCTSDNSFRVDEGYGQDYGEFCSFFNTPGTWWYMQIAEPGDLYMTIHSSVGDVDMACWGPFDNMTCDLADLSDNGTVEWEGYYGQENAGKHYSNSSSLTTTQTSTPICGLYSLARPCGNLVDYGGSTSGDEYLQIINAQRGEYYMVLVANYANRAGTISFTQTGGAGRASCDIVTNCDITSISASTECTSSNSYKVSGEVSFRDAPTDGTLTVALGSNPLTFTPPFASPIAYEFTGLTPNGMSQNITATFESSTVNCSKTSSFMSPSKDYCEEVVLPITLLSLHGECNGKRAIIAWTTASERNNDYFVVERSDDAMNFVEIGRVAGAGNSITALSYSFTDYGIGAGDNYYRLTQVDYDGTRTTSEIIEVHCSGNAPEGDPDVYVYPNPFNSDLTVHLVNFGDKPARIAVYDMLGRQLFERTAYPTFNDSEIVLQLGGLPDAAYTVRVSTSEFVVNRKVVKNK